jgi:hypothetical protein
LGEGSTRLKAKINSPLKAKDEWNWGNEREKVEKRGILNWEVDMGGTRKTEGKYNDANPHTPRQSSEK